ncbi:hypothetical protein X777_12572 [Ooceraea biroi]|uniref:Uncharacterized protein n=1 Tax=Ooceraea biroi TaxID=2015173 RepID=A0A026W297_OOCBI|nr:hypothetical protein X777_12572 [Ooceraea biroi]
MSSPSMKSIMRSAEGREWIVNIGTIISRRHTRGKKKAEKKSRQKKNDREGDFRSPLGRFATGPTTQIRREQPSRRARTGQTTFSTLQGACNFYCPIPFGKLLLVKEETRYLTAKVDEDAKFHFPPRFGSRTPLPHLVLPSASS